MANLPNRCVVANSNYNSNRPNTVINCKKAEIRQLQYAKDGLSAATRVAD